MKHPYVVVLYKPHHETWHSVCASVVAAAAYLNPTLTIKITFGARIDELSLEEIEEGSVDEHWLLQHVEVKGGIIMGAVAFVVVDS